MKVDTSIALSLIKRYTNVLMAQLFKQTFKSTKMYLLKISDEKTSLKVITARIAFLDTNATHFTSD